MVGRLQDKIALVVGAGSVGPGWGNGKPTAVLFAREGAKVLCADINEDAAKETVQIIHQENGTANAICADVTSHDDIQRMVKACTDIYGRIDVVDYNVGLAHVGGVVELPEEEWDRIFAVNLKGCFLTMKHVIQSWKNRAAARSSTFLRWLAFATRVCPIPRITPRKQR